METELAGDELLMAVRIPRFSRAARFGFHKICRKTGEFADAIGVVAYDPERRCYRGQSPAPRAVVSTPGICISTRAESARTAMTLTRQRLVQAALQPATTTTSSSTLSR